MHFEGRCPVHLGASFDGRRVTYDGESTRQKHARALASTSCNSPHSRAYASAKANRFVRSVK